MKERKNERVKRLCTKKKRERKIREKAQNKK
jgi:hypothetical protein